MLENEPTDTTTTDALGSLASSDAPTAAPPRRRRAASRPAGPPVVAPPAEPVMAAPAEPAHAPADTSVEPPAQEPAAPARRTRKTAAAKAAEAAAAAAVEAPSGADDAEPVAAPRRRTRKAAVPAFSAPDAPAQVAAADEARAAAAALLFMAPELAPADDQGGLPSDDEADADELTAEDEAAGEHTDDGSEPDDDEADEHERTSDADGAPRKRRRRGGRGRRRRPADGEPGESGDGAQAAAGADGAADGNDGAPSAGSDDEQADRPEGEDGDASEDGEGGATRRRRRRRRRGGSGDGDAGEESDGTVVHVREPREPREPRERNRSSRGGGGGGAGAAGDEVTAVRGSTRLEAKKQRRREGRDAGRRRPPILSEAEFLSRREAVKRVMVIRQHKDLTQIAVLEDGVLAEHYVASSASSTMQGNVYLGKVQNVLPSMEAAFIDIGRGRNAVLYAGEVNWDAAALDGQPRRIEHVMKSGDSILAQVTKDPLGHKGSRLTSNVSLAGRFLVYVPDGSMSGISRKLPDTERARLKAILKNVVPEDAGVIVRTAAEGATEEQLTHDVQRLQAQWEDIQKKAKTAQAPALLYGEPDLTVRVVRDLFNEDFESLVVSGDEAWEVVQAYVTNVAPDLMDRVSKYVGTKDAFAEYRIDEQIAKGLDRKVYLPSGGSLVIDRTEAMTVVDVNTGKFVGKGSGNLEETVTRNNLEAAEEIVRQLRLRDIGGIIVVDFIDMVLESNRELVLRRLTECLGRDRTKHQVAEVTSLGLVQMTRKRIGQGLLEAFSEPCEVCNGRGIKVHLEPIIARADREHGRGGHDAGQPALAVDQAERAARVAKIAKASKLVPAEPIDAAEATEAAAAGDEAAPAAKRARTRAPRAPRAAAAPATEPSTETSAEPSTETSAETGADAATEGAPVAKAPARRRRVAKKAQGSPAPAP